MLKAFTCTHPSSGIHLFLIHCPTEASIACSCEARKSRRVMESNSKLPVGVDLVKSDIGGLECPWLFMRGDMVWSKTEGWKEFYEGNREKCYFKSVEEAMKAWESSRQ